MVIIKGALEAESRLELVDARLGGSELEQLLRGDDDQGLAEVAAHLRAEDMEVLRSSRAVDYDHVGPFHNFSLGLILSGRGVVGVGELEETFNTRRRVLGTVAVIPVG